MQYLAIHVVKVSKIYSTHFFTILVQDPTIKYVEKKILKFLHFAIKMAIWIGIWWKKALGLQMVKDRSIPNAPNIPK